MSAMTEGKNIYVLKASCRGAIGTVSRLTTYLAQRHCYIMELAQFDEISTGNFYVRCVFSTTPGVTPKLDDLKAEFGHGVAHLDAMQWEMHDTLTPPKVLIMVSKFDHCLDDLLYRQRTGEIKMEIPAIVSNHPDLKRLADWHEIPFYHLPITPETKQEQERQLLELIEESGADLVVRQADEGGSPRPDASRMADSIETALRLSDGLLLVNLGTPDAPETAAVEVAFFFPGMNVYAR